MFKHPCLCIETGEDFLAVSRSLSMERGGAAAVHTEVLPLRSEIFLSPLAMAEALLSKWPDIVRWLRSSAVVLALRTGHASLRVETVLTGPENDFSDENRIKRAFPLGESAAAPFHERFNENTHVFDYQSYPEAAGYVLFMAALPVTIADALMSFTQAAGIPLGQVRRIDLSEHILLRYYGERRKESFWLVFPTTQGTRLLAVSGGLPRAAYFIADDPDYRLSALRRLWQTLPGSAIPVYAVIFSDATAPTWLNAFFLAQGVLVETPNSYEAHCAVGNYVCV